MKKFAKLFERPKYGQVLVFLHTSEDQMPQMRCMLQAEGLGVCQIDIDLKDHDEAERALARADAAFADKVAEAIASEVIAAIGGMDREGAA